METGYHSDPTTTSSTSTREHYFGEDLGGGRGRNGRRSGQVERDLDDAPHPSFSSLHGHSHFHLQSTPVKQLSRVQRVGRSMHNGLLASSVSASEVSSASVETLQEEEEVGDNHPFSQDGDEADNETEYAGTSKSTYRDHPSTENARYSDLGAKDYWKNLLSDVDGLPNRNSREVKAAGSIRVAHAPSTGSSTLVDQESLLDGHAGQKVQPNAKREDQARPSSAPPLSPAILADPPSHNAPPLVHRRSLLHTHVSRYTDLPVSRSPSNRLPTQAEVSQSSEAAARVHDIFARHIHEATSSNNSHARSNLAASSNASHAAKIASTRPRQRLRDLLTVSSSIANTSNHSSVNSLPEEEEYSVTAHKTARSGFTRSPSRARPSQSFLKEPPSHNQSNRHSSTQKAIEMSASRRSPTRRADVSSQLATPQDFDRLKRSTYVQTLENDVTSGVLQQQNDQSMETILTSGRLGREWKDVATRQAVLDLEVQQNIREDEEMYEDPLIIEREQRVNGYRDGILEQGRDRGQSRQFQEQLADGGSEEDANPSSPESRDECPPQPPYLLHSQRTPAFDRDYAYSPEDSDPEIVEEAQVYLAERRASPRTISVTDFRIRAVSDSAAASSSHPEMPSTIPTTKKASFAQRYSRRTPPKTPLPPGAYLSTTPAQASAVHSRRDLSPDVSEMVNKSAVDQNRSRLFDLPGTYMASPFPHPRRAHTDTGSMATSSSKLADSPRALSPLENTGNRAIQLSPGKSESQKKTSSASVTPIKQRTSFIKPSANPDLSLQNPSTSFLPDSPSNLPSSKIPLPLPSTPINEAVTSHVVRSDTSVGEGPLGNETAIVNLFSDLARPMKALLGAMSSPSPVRTQAGKGKIPEAPVTEEGDNSMMEYTNVLAQRKKRSVS